MEDVLLRSVGFTWFEPVCVSLCVCACARGQWSNKSWWCTRLQLLSHTHSLSDAHSQPEKTVIKHITLIQVERISTQSESNRRKSSAGRVREHGSGSKGTTERLEFHLHDTHLPVWIDPFESTRSFIYETICNSFLNTLKNECDQCINQ